MVAPFLRAHRWAQLWCRPDGSILAPSSPVPDRLDVVGLPLGSIEAPCFAKRRISPRHRVCTVLTCTGAATLLGAGLPWRVAACAEVEARQSARIKRERKRGRTD